MHEADFVKPVASRAVAMLGAWHGLKKAARAMVLVLALSRAEGRAWMHAPLRAPHACTLHKATSILAENRRKG